LEPTSNNVFMLRTTLFLAVVALLPGCVTTNFQSNSDFKSLRPFSRILVVSKLPQVTPDYLDAYLTSFPNQYDVCVLDASLLSFGNPDSLIAQKARECKSEVILTLDLNRSYTVGRLSGGEYSNGQISSASDIYLEMASFPDRQPFWKSLASTNGSIAIKPRRIVQQLQTDALIEGKIPPASY
jgi:hypothetical protein